MYRLVCLVTTVEQHDMMMFLACLPFLACVSTAKAMLFCYCLMARLLKSGCCTESPKLMAHTR